LSSKLLFSAGRSSMKRSYALAPSAGVEIESGSNAIASQWLEVEERFCRPLPIASTT